MSGLSALAPAKINLYLHVTGKRPDNYHLLDSLVVFANINDVIEVVSAATITVTAKGDYAASISAEENSVKKAAEALRTYFGIKSGATITLHKNLPIGAGIGGGSADAAATIKLLVRLWKIQATEKDLHAIALSIGADVPACLQSSALYMHGIGEIIEKAPKLPKLHIVLVGTGKPLLTKEVFTQYSGRFSPAAHPPKTFASHEDFLDFLNKTGNDLQAPAIELMPEIAIILDALKAEKDCLIARMSGSGATCFGLFAKRKFAEEVAIKLSNQYPQWWIKVAKYE